MFDMIFMRSMLSWTEPASFIKLPLIEDCKTTFQTRPLYYFFSYIHANGVICAQLAFTSF